MIRRKTAAVAGHLVVELPRFRAKETVAWAIACGAAILAAQMIWSILRIICRACGRRVHTMQTSPAIGRSFDVASIVRRRLNCKRRNGPDI